MSHGLKLSTNKAISHSMHAKKHERFLKQIKHAHTGACKYMVHTQINANVKGFSTETEKST